MVSESEKRAASLAVSRFGADHGRVSDALRSVVQAQARGHTADFLDTLVAEKILTTAQARELRLALDTTHFDLRVGPPDAGANGGPNPNSPTIELPVRPSPPDPPATPGPGPTGDLRRLGAYRILRLLGEGGMGAVYLGYHEQEKRQVAIKVLSEQLSTYQTSVDRFYREAKSGALLDHPNIVRNLNVGQDRETGKHYLVLEYVDGPSAHALLNQFGRLPVGDAVHIILDVARALEHAHSRNIIHRDIKPDNILITTSGLAKLADLGLAKRTDETSHLTAARQGFGTPFYMPYEQAMNAKSVDGRSDIYALGATLYHLLTGEVPFPGASHVEVVDKKNLGFFPPAGTVNPAVPAELDRILEKMLAREPRNRYQTASELIVDLERANLAAAVPSFIDFDQALQDPLVRARLTSPAQPTAPDLDRVRPDNGVAAANGNPDLWFLRYRDRTGQWCKTRATTRQVLQRLREGRLPRKIEAGHRPQGPFQPLAEIAEFHEAAVSQAKRGRRSRPGKPSDPSSRHDRDGRAPASSPHAWLSRPWFWVTAAGLGLVLAGAVVVYFLVLAS